MPDIDDYRVPNSAPSKDEKRKGQAYANPDFPPPASMDAERTVVGAVLLDSSYHSEAAEVLTPSDFFLDSHRIVFQRMTDLADAQQTIDLVTLSEELRRNKELEAVGGVAWLSSLTEGLPRRPRITDYVKLIRDKSMARRAMSICSAAIARYADQSETALEVLEDLESQLIDVAQSAVTGTLRTVKDSVEIAGGVDQYMGPILDPVETGGLQTGLYDFDDMIGGLKKGELMVIAARPSMGKSGLLNRILQNICVGTEQVAGLFSIEMTRESNEKRLLASIGQVSLSKIMTGKFMSADDKRRLFAALSTLVETDNLFIDDTAALTPTQMRAKARRLKQRKGRLDALGVDYMQLMSGGKRFTNRQEEVSYISRSLKLMAKELDVPVIALAQLNRANEQRTDKRPILSDLRESGSIEADADVIAFLHRDSYYNRDEEMSEYQRAVADLILAKNRNGPTGVAKLVFLSPFASFDNLARGNDDGRNRVQNEDDSGRGLWPQSGRDL